MIDPSCFTFLRKSDPVAGFGRLPLADAVDGADTELVSGGRLQRRQNYPARLARNVSYLCRPAVDRVGNGTGDGHGAFLDDEFRDGAVAVEAGHPRHVDRLAHSDARCCHSVRRVRQLDDVQVGLARVVATG